MINDDLRWNWNYSSTKTKVSEGTLFQVLPSNVGTNLYVFEKDGEVLHVDGYSGEVIDRNLLSVFNLCAVERILVGGETNYLVADVSGLMWMYKSFDSEPLSFGRRMNEVHAIADIGRSNALIAYTNENDSVTIELISTKSGRIYDSIKIDDCKRIKHLFCAPDFYGKVNVRARMGTDHSIIKLNVKNKKLEIGTTELTDKNVYLDELYTNGKGIQLYAYHYYDENDQGRITKSSEGVMAFDRDEKLGTVTYEFETKIVGERNKIRVTKENAGVNRTIPLGNDVLFKHIHFPKHRIVGITESGFLYRICFRQQSVAFIQDA
jgi:hypothetical protein